MRKLFLSERLVACCKQRLLYLARIEDSSTIIANVGWQLLEKAFRLCFTLASVILLARYLQPEQYGVYNYALAYTSFFVAVSSLGANQIFIRDLVSDKSSSQEIISTAIALRLLSGILSLATAIAVAFALIDDAVVQALVAVFSLQMIFRTSEVIECFFHARTEYKHITYSRSIASGIATTLTVIAILQKQSIFVIAVASSLEFLLSLLLISAAYINRRSDFRFSHISLVRLKRNLSDSWPLMLSSFAITIYMKVDQMMISSMSGNSQLGLYSATVQLTEVFYIVPVALIHSTFPKLIRLKKNDEEVFYSSLQKLYNKVSLISYASILFVSLFAKQLVGIIYGENYIEATPVLCTLIWSVMFVALGVARSSFMIAMNWTKIQLATVVTASVMNVALNYILIPKYGALGAAVATALSYWFAAHGACFLFKPLRRTGRMITRSLIFIG